MRSRYVVVSGVIFGLMALAQLLRAVKELPVQVGGVEISDRGVLGRCRRSWQHVRMGVCITQVRPMTPNYALEQSVTDLSVRTAVAACAQTPTVTSTRWLVL